MNETSLQAKSVGLMDIAVRKQIDMMPYAVIRRRDLTDKVIPFDGLSRGTHENQIRLNM